VHTQMMRAMNKRLLLIRYDSSVRL
jgi:hypothetical protein